MGDRESRSGDRQPRRRRAWSRLAGAALAMLALLAIAYATRDAWAAPLALRWLRQRLRAELGAELTVADVSSRGLESWTFEGVRWRCSRTPLLAVEDARVELEFSLRGAWHGKPEPVLRVEGRGIELALPEGAQEGGGGTLPDVRHVELDLRDVLVRRPDREPLRLDGVQASGALEAMHVRLERLELSASGPARAAGPARLALHDAELDLGAGDALAIVRSARGKLEASLPDAALLAEWLEAPPPLRSAELTLDLATGSARLTGRAELQGGTLAIEHGELTLPPGGGLHELELVLGMHADLADLAPLGAHYGVALAGRWSGAVDVRGPLHAPVGRFTGHGEGLRVDALDLGAFDVDLETNGKRVRLERCEITGPELVAVLRGDVELDPLALVDVALNVSADRGALAALVPVPCEHAFLHARLDGPPTSPHGAFEVSATDVEVSSMHVDDAAARGRIEDGALQVQEVRLTSGASAIEAAGTLRRDGSGYAADVERLALDWEGAHVELQHGGKVAFGPGRVAIEGLELASESDGKHGSARIALDHSSTGTHASLDFTDYDAGPLLAPFLPEGLQAGTIGGHVEGALLGAALDEAPALALDLTLEGWRVGPAWPALGARLRGRYDGRLLELEEVELGFAGDEAAHARGSLRVPVAAARPLEIGAGPLALDLELTTNDAVRTAARAQLDTGLSSTGPCRLTLDLAGDREHLRGGLGLDARKVTLGTEATSRACDLLADVAFGERIEVTRAEFTAPSGTITLSGSVAEALEPLRWSRDPRALAEAPLALTAKVDLADVGWIAGLSAELRRISGQVAGRVGIGGTALEPSLTGSLEWSDGELRLSSSATPVRALAARISFDRDVVNVDELTGEIGGAPLTVTGTVEPFGPFPRLDLNLRGDSMLLARSSTLRLRADADLRVKGTPSQLSIRGEMAVAEGLYLGEISPLEELLRLGKRTQSAGPGRLTLWSEGPLADAHLDVHLGGKKTFEYRTNLLVAALRPDAWLRGTGEFPVLEGQAYVEEAKLTLPSGELKLSSGLLTFRPEEPLSPEVALKAEMRVQRHDVQAVVAGRIDEPDSIQLSSSPPLPQDDLWILVLTGQLPATDRSSQAMEALAVFLAKDSLVRWFGSEPSDTESLLERFEIEVGAQTSQTGQPTGRVLFYLKPQTRKTGRATYLSAEIDEYDQVNYAFGVVFRPR